MCGRYELHSHPATIALAFALAYPPELNARYNIAPMTDVPIIRVDAEGERQFVPMRWGLVPRWAKDPSIGSRLINARGETIADKPSFQMAYRRHRCLLPADGFYEWKNLGGATGAGAQARKQPHHIGMKDGGLFAFAGLYERWRSDDGVVLDTCAIVTTKANALLETLHDRMPVIVAAEHYARWLDPANTDVMDLVAPYRADAMAYHPVSSRVNNVRNDDASLIEQVDPIADALPADPAPSPHVPEQESLF